ncbi:MAG: hypothetical protein R3F35_22270 [Myxococcota bacterium]
MDETQISGDEFEGGACGSPRMPRVAEDAQHELELGGLVAALSASTEDETELDLRLRAIVEGGRHRITIGTDTRARALEN